MIVKLLTEHHLDFLSLKGGCRGSSESHMSKCHIVGISCHGSYGRLNIPRISCMSTLRRPCKYHMHHTKRILGESLLISSLPDKALRTHVDIARLAERFNMRSQSRAW